MYNLCPAVNGAKILLGGDQEGSTELTDPRYYDPVTIDNLLDLDEGRTECTVRFVYDPDAETITLHYKYPEAQCE